MSLESFRSFISKVSTDLTTVADVQAMQLVQPIRNRLQRKHGDKYLVDSYIVIHFGLIYSLRTQNTTNAAPKKRLSIK